MRSFSQIRPRYKPKISSYLRPILKKFKKGGDYAKHDDDGSAIFRSNSKFQESCKFFFASTANKLVSSFNKKAEDSMKIVIFQLGYHMLISDAEGTLRRLLTSNVQTKDAQRSKFIICNGKFMKNDTIMHLKLGFNKFILDKGGTTIQRLLSQREKLKPFWCKKNAFAQQFDALQFLGTFQKKLTPPIIVPVDKTRIAPSVFDEIPDSSCCVVIHYDMCYCKDLGILKHFSSKYVEQRKLDDAFTVANHIPKLVDGCSVLGSLLLRLWSSNLLWGASITLLLVVEAIIAIPPCTTVIVWVRCQHLCKEDAT
ncbi:hypothetical protein C1H46_015491 [Malus baccata]|uniref:Uncharacterized protein n=1 Tax=Malus baccata TaxID=106549 RepID=A0A540MJ85_MALBA|nr:hypothetical protein C1H46_015491 [Malus baccata]